MTQQEAIQMGIEALERLLPPFNEGYISEFERLGFDAIAALLSTSDWQPMAAAPRDRKYILAFSPDRHMSFQVRWNETAGDWCLIGSDGSHWEELTHWRPLPAPPEADKC